MKKKAIMLVGGLGLALAGLAEPAIKDGSVIGYWKFDSTSNYGQDSSGYQGSSSLGNATTSSTGGYAGGKIALEKGKSTTATIGSAAPAFCGTTYPYYTTAARFKSGGTIVSGFAAIGVDEEVKNVLNDTSNWHFGAMRYQSNKDSGKPNTNSSYDYAIIIDPRYEDADGMAWIKPDGTTDSSRSLEMTSNSSDYMITVANGTVTIGGSIKGKSWYGSVDEVMIVNRLLTKRELARLNYTGETYVYCYKNTPSFASASNWSCNEGSCSFAPGGAVGVAYIVDNGLTMTQGGTATFGVSTDNKVSLTLGRKTPLTFPHGTETITKGVNGNFNQNSAGTLTFYDLRLVQGTWTAGGTGLAAMFLDVEAPSGTAYVLAAANDFALNVGAATTGAGVLAKTGAGKLTVNAWTGTAKLRLAEGSVKTPRFNGYAGGTVLVSTGSTVAFAGDDVLPTTANKMKILFDGTKPTAKTAVMTVPAGVTAAMIQDTTSYDNGQVGMVTVENGTVYVEPVYPEDLGSVPVLMAE